MRVLISTFGTRGDVEPYLALAQRLVSEGHEAVVNAPATYRGDAEQLGIGFEPMGTELHELVRSSMTSMSGAAQSMKLVRQMTAAQVTSLHEQWAAAQKVDPTIIVTHPKALGGRHIAERLGIPFVASMVLPFLTRTSAFPIPVTTAKLPGWLNRRSYVLNRASSLAYGGMVNTFRTETLGLRRLSRMDDYLHHNDGSLAPVLYGFSRHVVPIPEDYPDNAHVTGYWTRPAAEVQPPQELVAFLEQPGPVVYAGFGSMGFGRKAEERSRLMLAAIERAGARAVLARGWGGLDSVSSDRVFVVDEVAHEWLFPRVDAVIHHGGAGTTAAGLRAGRPTLICPFLADQPFWGERVHDLGVGPAPLPAARFSEKALDQRLAQLLGDSGYRDTARQIASQLAHEDGTGEAVTVLAAIEGVGSPW